MDLLDHAAWIEHVLEYRLSDDRIHARVGKRDLMGIGDELRHRAAQTAVGQKGLDLLPSDHDPADEPASEPRLRAQLVEGVGPVELGPGARLTEERGVVERLHRQGTLTANRASNGRPPCLLAGRAAPPARRTETGA